MAESAAKIEQYLLLAKNAKGLALVDLVGKAVADPQLFAFGELLSLPAVQQVRPTGMGDATRCGAAG